MKQTKTTWNHEKITKKHDQAGWYRRRPRETTTEPDEANENQLKPQKNTKKHYRAGWSERKQHQTTRKHKQTRPSLMKQTEATKKHDRAGWRKQKTMTKPATSLSEGARIGLSPSRVRNTQSYGDRKSYFVDEKKRCDIIGFCLCVWIRYIFCGEKCGAVVKSQQKTSRTFGKIW